jgi:hypothetical protein
MTQAVRAYVLPYLRNAFAAGGNLCAALCLLLALVRPPDALALPPQEIIMDPPVAVVEHGMLTWKLAITVDNEDGLLELLKDGAVLELAISVVVERERTLWTNAEAAKVEFPAILRHDPLSRDFVAFVPTFDGEKEVRDRNLSRLLQASWRRISLPVVSLADMVREEPAKSYLVLLTIALRHTEVPPWLEKSSVFWSPEVVPQVNRKFVFTPPHVHADAR